MRHTTHVLRLAAVTGLLAGWTTAASWAQAPETFTATASLKTRAGGQATAPVTVVVTRLTTEKEHAAVTEALKKGGAAAVVESLKTMADAGYIEVGERRTTLKYAYARSMGGGRLLTVVAPTPIAYLGAGPSRRKAEGRIRSGAGAAPAEPLRPRHGRARAGSDDQGHRHRRHPDPGLRRRGGAAHQRDGEEIGEPAGYRRSAATICTNRIFSSDIDGKIVAKPMSGRSEAAARLA